MGCEPGAVATIGQNLAMKHRQGGRAGAGGGTGITGRAERRGGLRESQYLPRIDRPRVDGKGIAGTAPADQAGLAQRSAQHRDLGLQGVRRDSAGLLGPQILEKVFGPDELTGCDGQPHQQLRRLAGRQLQASTVASYLDRSQNGHRQHVMSIRLTRRLGEGVSATSASRQPPQPGCFHDPRRNRQADPAAHRR